LGSLEENGISVIDSWIESPENLANMLGVDAVVRGRIQKEKYFSDELSAGIELGTVLLDMMGSDFNPFVSSNNKKIKTDYALVDSENGNVLWSIQYSVEADWRQRPDQIVDRINHRSANHFPYRTK